MIKKTFLPLSILAILAIMLVVSAQIEPPKNDVMVDVIPDSQSGMPGDIPTYDIKLTNNGTVPDIIVVDSITGIPTGWMFALTDGDNTVALPYLTPLLQNHTSYNLSLDVHIPDDTAPITESMCIEIYSYADSTKRDNATFWCNVKSSLFDTDNGTYPSIMGTHRGTLRLDHNFTVHRMYTYPCKGTGGHNEYAAFYENGKEIANGTWKGYQGQGDYHYIEFEPFALKVNITYEYKIITSSYPQIHHNTTLNLSDGEINCTEFVDANGKIYKDWIPAIKLE
jgi:hypothetical protein